MSLQADDSGSVCQYNLLHAQQNVPAVGVINCGPELGDVPACQVCLNFIERITTNAAS